MPSAWNLILVRWDVSEGEVRGERGSEVCFVSCLDLV